MIDAQVESTYNPLKENRLLSFSCRSVASPRLSLKRVVESLFRWESIMERSEVGYLVSVTKERIGRRKNG